MGEENKFAEWWVGSNEEFLNIAGPVMTRDEAIKVGREHQLGDPFYICRAALHVWNAPDAVQIMDNWVENHDELWFEDGFPGFDGSREQELEAESDLQSVLNAWFERHRHLCPGATAFAWSADGEWIDKEVTP